MCYSSAFNRGLFKGSYVLFLPFEKSFKYYEKKNSILSLHIPEKKFPLLRLRSSTSVNFHVPFPPLLFNKTILTCTTNPLSLTYNSHPYHSTRKLLSLHLPFS